MNKILLFLSQCRKFFKFRPKVRATANERDLRKYIHIMGVSGGIESVFLEHMIYSGIGHGNSFVFMDPNLLMEIRHTIEAVEYQVPNQTPEISTIIIRESILCIKSN